MHWQAWRELLLSISITIHHFGWIISQADNSSTYHHSQTKQALFGRKRRASLVLSVSQFLLLLLFFVVFYQVPYSSVNIIKPMLPTFPFIFRGNNGALSVPLGGKKFWQQPTLSWTHTLRHYVFSIHANVHTSTWFLITFPKWEPKATCKALLNCDTLSV